MVVLGDYHQFLKIHGIWFEVKAQPIPTDVIVIDGLHYKPAQVAPVYRTWRHRDIADIAPPDGFPYKIVDGKLYEPCDGRETEGKVVGPKDCLIEEASTRKLPFWNRHNYNSVKITLYRQLNHKDLKHHGLKNDRTPVLGARCKKCGGIFEVDCHIHRCTKCKKYFEECKCWPRF